MDSITTNLAVERSALRLMKTANGPDVFDALVQAGVTEESFFSINHKILWKVLVDAGGVYDSSTVTKEFQKKADALKQPVTGGAKVIVTEILHNGPALEDPDLSEIISSLLAQKHRSQVDALTANYRRDLNSGKDPEAALEELNTALASLLDTENKSNVAMHGDAVAQATTDILSGKKIPVVIPTGLSTLDYALNGGIQCGSLVSLIAPTGHGKTSMAVTFSRAAIQAGATVVFFTVESDEHEILMRFLSQESGVPLSHVSRNKYDSADERKRVEAAGQRLAKNDALYIMNPAQREVGPVRAEVRRILRKDPKRKILVVFDYLGLMTPPTVKGRADEAWKELVLQMQRMAVADRVAVLLLNQVGREAGGKLDKMPSLRSATETREVEFSSYVVMTMHRPFLDDMSGAMGDETVAEIKIQKNRYARITSTIMIKWVPELTMFTDGNTGPAQATQGGFNMTTPEEDIDDFDEYMATSGPMPAPMYGI